MTYARVGRRVRAAVVGVGLLATVTLGACGAGVSGDDSAASGADGNPAWVEAYNATLGRVVVMALGSTGKPVDGASVVAYNKAGKRIGGDGFFPPVTDESGRIVLYLQPGRYRITAERHDGLKASGRVAVRTGEDVPLRLTLE